MANPTDEKINAQKINPIDKSEDVRMTGKSKRSHTDRIIEEDNLSPMFHSKSRSQPDSKVNEHKRLL